MRYRPESQLHLPMQTPFFRKAAAAPKLTARAAATEATMATEASVGGDAKLAALRELMRKADGGKGVDAYIIPTEDPHMASPPPATYSRIMWTLLRRYLQACVQQCRSLSPPKVLSSPHCLQAQPWRQPAACPPASASSHNFPAVTPSHTQRLLMTNHRAMSKRFDD